MRGLIPSALLNPALVVVLALTPLPMPGAAANAELEPRSSRAGSRWPFASRLFSSCSWPRAPGTPGRCWLAPVLLWAAPVATYGLIAFGSRLGDLVVGAPLVLLVGAIAANALEGFVAHARVAQRSRARDAPGVALLPTALALLPYDRARQRAEADEPYYLLAMRSLVVDHDLDLRNQYD